jgi:hypothetical protein
MILTFEKARVQHAIDLVPLLREPDRRELTLSNGSDLVRTLALSIAYSEVAIVALEDGVPIAMWGIVRCPEGGVIWLVGSDRMYSYKRSLFVDTRTWLGKIIRYYGSLFNYVHIKNTVTLRWLERLGFTRGGIVENYGQGDEPFIRMTLKE